MRTLHLYLMRQVLATLLMTVAVFTFVLLLGNALKEILELLINRQATIGGVMHAFGLLIPFVLVFALPMGMLTAALLVFGRFSADQELTAVKSSGISLISLITPILILSLLLCGVSAWINLEVAPKCRVAYKSLLHTLGVKAIASMLPEGHYTSFKNGMVWVGKNDGKGVLGDLVILRAMDDGTDGFVFVSAKRGWIETVNQTNYLHLEDVRGINRVKEPGLGTLEDPNPGPIPLDVKTGSAEEEKPALTDMTFRQLQTELNKLEHRYEASTTSMTPDEMVKWKEVLAGQKADMTMPLRVQMHRQVAFSFACFGFTLVGIPLGIRAHRRETNAGFAMALILVLIYYSFIILGQSLQTHAELVPYLIVWLPNFLFQAVGAVMLWRANRGI
jgi:lipopolysaccharide export system permease protein